MIASAETPADLRQRPQGEGLCEVHRDLSRPHDIRGASRRQQVGTAHIILARHDPLDVLDLDPLRFLRTDQVAHLAFGHFERHGMTGELVMGEQAIERTFEIAAIVGDGLRNIAKHRQGHVEGRVMRARSQNARLENFKSQLFAERPHLDDQSAGEPRANAIIEALEIGRRAIGGDDHLTTGVDQRVERMAELRLGRFALQELQVVDHQNADSTQGFLEGEGGLRAQRGNKAVHELLGRKVEHLPLTRCVAGPGHGLQQMRLAEAHARMDVKRIEHHRVATLGACDLFRGGMGKGVGTADDKGIECQARVER